MNGKQKNLMLLALLNRILFKMANVHKKINPELNKISKVFNINHDFKQQRIREQQ